MIKYLRKNLIITFILTLIFGFILVFQTQEFLLTINYVIVSIFAIIGLTRIISYIFSKAYKNNSYYGLIMGIICIWIALTFYLYYETIIIFLPIIISLYTFIIASLSLIRAIQNDKKSQKITYIITSIISIIFGIMLLFLPLFTIDIYLKISGIYIVITSVFYMIEFYKIGKEVKKNG